MRFRVTSSPGSWIYQGLWILGFLAFLIGCRAEAASNSGAARPGPAGSDITLEGPFTHQNLAIYVVRGRTADPRAFITLDEGLAAKTVAVRERGARAGRDEAEVNQLEVENKSDRWLYLQAGDVVKGGKQDRTIGIDITLAPHSAPQPIDAFCVEHGRWTVKGDGLRFSGNTGIVSGNALKMSIQGEKNQSRVWAEVARQESQAAAVAMPAGAGGEGTLSSTGTYNAIVDHDKIRSSRETYVKALLPHLRKADDALGMVVAINGEITAADIYASTPLFRKISGKLLDSYALEAVLGRDTKGRKAPPPPAKDAVSGFLKEPAKGQPHEEQVGKTMHRRTRETEDAVLYEYRDTGTKAGPAAEPVHRNYLKKSKTVN